MKKHKIITTGISLLFLSFFTYAQILEPLRLVDSREEILLGKPKCNLNSTNNPKSKANICNGSFCEWTDREDGTNWGKCG